MTFMKEHGKKILEEIKPNHHEQSGHGHSELGKIEGHHMGKRKL